MGSFWGGGERERFAVVRGASRSLVRPASRRNDNCAPPPSRTLYTPPGAAARSLVAANREALAARVTDERRALGCVYPPLEEVGRLSSGAEEETHIARPSSPPDPRARVRATFVTTDPRPPRRADRRSATSRSTSRPRSPPPRSRAATRCSRTRRRPRPACAPTARPRCTTRGRRTRARRSRRREEGGRRHVLHVARPEASVGTKKKKRGGRERGRNT